MSDSRKASIGIMSAVLFVLAFAGYHIILFSIAGFSGHGASFWISYGFMLAAFASTVISCLILKGRRESIIIAKDWIFGFPVLRHCAIHIVAELIISILFMVLDIIRCPWAIPLAIQLILLIVHLVFIISCFIAKQTIEAVEENVKINTSFIKGLQIEVEMIAQSSANPDIKREFGKLAEQIRFSDPVSSPALHNIENTLSICVNQAKNCVALNEINSALEYCNKASLMLIERNKRCKAFK